MRGPGAINENEDEETLMSPWSTNDIQKDYQGCI